MHALGIAPSAPCFADYGLDVRKRAFRLPQSHTHLLLLMLTLSPVLLDHAQALIGLLRHVLPLGFAYEGNGCRCVQTTALRSLKRLERLLS